MSTSFSASRWTFLLTLAVVMLVCASQARSSPSHAHPCCDRSQTRKVTNIMKCYKQQYRGNCPYDAFLIVTRSSSKPICVQKDAQWLKRDLNKKKLTCTPQFTSNGRFKLLDVEDDMEW